MEEIISAQQIRHWFARYTSMPLPLPRATRSGAGCRHGPTETRDWELLTHSVVPFPAAKCSPMSRAVERCICQGWQHWNFFRQVDENCERDSGVNWKEMPRLRFWNNCRLQTSVLGGCRPRRNRRLRIGDPLADLMLSAAPSKFRGGWGKRRFIMERFT